MYPSTNRHQSSFASVKNPSTTAVVGSALAAAAVSLVVVAVLSHPAIGLAATATIAIAYRLLIVGRTGRSRRRLRHGLADVVGRSPRPPAGDGSNTSRSEDAA